VKLYLDENLLPRLAEMLRARGLEVVSAYGVGNAALDDRAQLAYATREGRAIVTCDISDFTVLAADALAANTQHAGIILISSRFGTDEFAATAEGIEAVVRRYPDGIPGAVVYVTRPAR
jgi:uncharacterized protein with PIN domain